VKYKRSTMINVVIMPFLAIVGAVVAYCGPQIQNRYKTNRTEVSVEEPKSHSESVAESVDTTIADGAVAESQNKITDEQYNLWSQEQIQNLEIPVKNPISYEQNIKKTVNQLSKFQINNLKNKVVNSKLPMNERIFSNYALTLLESQDSNRTIYELLMTPVPDFQNVQPHTENEIKRAQEYALKYVEIDELAKRSESGDNQARMLLSQVAQNSIDLKIKNYAERKLKEIR
jgi:hypothetical protein